MKNHADKEKKLLSVIIPCYNEEVALPLFYSRITSVCDSLNELECEIIFIDDGSRDGTLSLVKQYHSTDIRVRFISFSRNFGKEAGIYAGLCHAKGDFVVLLDADLQHPPEYIPEMYSDIVNEGYDSVAMYRRNRKGEKRVRSFFSKRFYRLINRLSQMNLVDGATDYRMMTRQVVDTILSMQEYNRFTKGIFSWVGFNTKWLPFDNTVRIAGVTKWSFKGLIKYSLEGIIAFSTAPLALASIFGIIFCILAFIMAIIVVIKTLVWGDPVAGFPSLFCMMLFLGGVQLLFLGIQGQYLSKMYLETKKRPIYIVKETDDSYNLTNMNEVDTVQKKEES